YWWQMRRLRATVVHYHYARWSTLVAAGLARRSHPGTWIATVHGHDIERALNSRIPGVRRLARWALSRFDQLIAVSNAVAEVISQPGGPPVAIIPAYLPPSSGHAYREESPEKRPTALLSATGVATKACTDVYGLDIGGAIL